MGRRVAITAPGATPALFICGVARSGTTLLLRLLDHHPELAVLPDESYAYAGLLKFRPWGMLFRISEIMPSDRLRSRMARLSLQVMPKALRPDWGEALRRYDIRSPQPHSTKRLWVEKSPSNERFYPLIEADLGARTKYIHIMRDPRDVIASWMLRQQPKLSDRPALIRRVGRLWANSALSAHMNSGRAGDRYRIVMFEQLATNPEKVMAEIADWLGIAKDPILMQATRMGEPQAINSSYYEQVTDGQVSPLPAGRHSAVLDAAEVRSIERRLKRHMERLGYGRAEAESRADR